jgi:hypothetical protein
MTDWLQKKEKAAVEKQSSPHSRGSKLERFAPEMRIALNLTAAAHCFISIVNWIPHLHL